MSEVRYSRQNLIESWDQEKLTRAKVLMVGAGTLGNHIGIGLCGLGIGNIFIYDMDVIEIHNLNRQSLFTQKDVGKSKATVLKERLEERNPSLKVFASEEKVDENNIDLLLDGIDIIIDGLDNVKTRQILSEHALLRDIPMVHGAISYNGGEVGVITRETACAGCIYGEIDEQAPCADALPGVVYSGQIIAGLMVEQIRKILNPLPEENLPLAPNLYYYADKSPHFQYKPLKRREGCICNEILQEVAPEILKKEAKKFKRSNQETNQEVAAFLQSDKCR